MNLSSAASRDNGLKLHPSPSSALSSLAPLPNELPRNPLADTPDTFDSVSSTASFLENFRALSPDAFDPPSPPWPLKQTKQQVRLSRERYMEYSSSSSSLV